MENNILLKKTQVVILITLITMIAEIYFGFITHSMALLADGFHMGTHAFALLITLFVCYLAIKFENKEEKFNALGGYTSAILLGFTSLGIIWESVERFFNPLSISFSEAILVAIAGLVINVICVFLMGENHVFGHNHCHHHNHENLNYKAAYMHILADAFTSVLAIAALLLGKYFGLVFLDPVIGLLGGYVIAKWAVGLMMKSGKILLE